MKKLKWMMSAFLIAVLAVSMLGSSKKKNGGGAE